jgi:uncharacterized protein YgbK (DUF1537 family)
MVHRIRCIIIADDLTGAADSSAALAAHGLGVHITPWPASGDIGRSVRETVGRPDVDILVVETGSRDLDAATAGRRLTAVAAALQPLVGHSAAAAGSPEAPWVIKKIDSVLRGPIAAEVESLRTAIGSTTTVIAPAFPRLGRTTQDGVQLLDGVPVGTSATDPVPGRTAADAEVARACGLPDAALRAPGAGPVDGTVTVHDARTGTDLERLADAVVELHPRPLVVCSAGLLEHLAPHLVPQHVRGDAVRTAAPVEAGGATLVISLSPTAAATAQLHHLVAERDATRIDLAVDAALADPETAGAALGTRLAAALADGASRPVLLSLEGDDRVAEGTDAVTVRDAIIRAIDTALTATTRPAEVLANGGDAARLVVDRWYPSSLEVIGQLPHGGALTRGADGALLAMKSGGFGPATALSDIVDVLPARAVHIAGAHPS